MFRTPLVAKTQATRGLCSAAINPLEKGELIICSRVKRACRAGTPSRNANNTVAARRKELASCRGVIGTEQTTTAAGEGANATLSPVQTIREQQFAALRLLRLAADVLILQQFS